MKASNIVLPRLTVIVRAYRQCSMWTLSLIFFFIALTKSGLTWSEQVSSDRLVTLQSEAWWEIIRDPPTWLPIMLQIRSRPVFEAFGFIMTILGWIALTWIIRRERIADRYTLLPLILLGVPGGMLLMGFGGDQILGLVAVTWLVARGPARRWDWLPVGLALSTVNINQAILSSGLLLGLALFPTMRAWRGTSAKLFLTTLVSGLVDRAIATSFRAPTQLDTNIADMHDALSTFVVGAPILIFSMYGVGWLVVLIYCMTLPRLEAIASACLLAVVPVLAMSLTLDGTRVGAGTAMLPYMAVLFYVLRSINQRASSAQVSLISFLVLVLCILLPVITVGRGVTIIPYSWLNFEITFWKDVLQT